MWDPCQLCGSSGFAHHLEIYGVPYHFCAFSSLFDSIQQAVRFFLISPGRCFYSPHGTVLSLLVLWWSKDIKITWKKPTFFSWCCSALGIALHRAFESRNLEIWWTLISGTVYTTFGAVQRSQIRVKLITSQVHPFVSKIRAIVCSICTSLANSYVPWSISLGRLVIYSSIVIWCHLQFYFSLNFVFGLFRWILRRNIDCPVWGDHCFRLSIVATGLGRDSFWLSSSYDHSCLISFSDWSSQTHPWTLILYDLLVQCCRALHILAV